MEITGRYISVAENQAVDLRITSLIGEKNHSIDELWQIFVGFYDEPFDIVICRDDKRLERFMMPASELNENHVDGKAPQLFHRRTN
jgi:hypothetical protein